MSNNPFLNGRCFDFALALHELIPDAEFIAVGNPKYPDHVALRKRGVYLDVRGAIPSFASMVAGMSGGLEMREDVDVHVIEQDRAALFCGYAGMTPPYPRLPRLEAKRVYRSLPKELKLIEQPHEDEAEHENSNSEMQHERPRG